MPSGIYKILNKINNKFYIGSSDHVTRRWREHTNLLNRNAHFNRHLQFAWNKYGCDAFEFSIIEICENSVIVAREQFWLDWFKSYDDNVGYNLAITANSTLGMIFPPEFGQKVRERRLGTKASEETKARISASGKGKVMSQEAINKIIASKAVYGINSDRIGMKYNKPNRVWACPDGQKCKCHPCRTRKGDYTRKYRDLKVKKS